MNRHSAVPLLVAMAATMLIGACAQGGPPDGDRAAAGQRGRAASQDMGGPRLGTMRSPDEARRWLVEQSARQLGEAQRQLNIGASQSAAWDAYAASVGALVSDLSRFEAEPLGATSMQRVDRRVDRARNRYTALESVADAMRGLYATFSDEQRATADRVLAGTLPSIYEGNPFGGPDPGATQPSMNSSMQRRSRGDPPSR